MFRSRAARAPRAGGRYGRAAARHNAPDAAPRVTRPEPTEPLSQIVTINRMKLARKYLHAVTLKRRHTLLGTYIFFVYVCQVRLGLAQEGFRAILSDVAVVNIEQKRAKNHVY